MKNVRVLIASTKKVYLASMNYLVLFGKAITCNPRRVRELTSNKDSELKGEALNDGTFYR